MWIVLAPAAALWFAAIALVNVARSPQDTIPPEFANAPPQADTAHDGDDPEDPAPRAEDAGEDARADEAAATPVN